MENDTHIKDLIDRWPSRKALADETGAPESSVHKWAQNGRIPSGWQKAVLVAAHSRGFDDITPEWMLSAHATGGRAA